MGIGTGLEDHSGIILLDRSQVPATTEVCLLRCSLLPSLLLLLLRIHETEQNSYCEQIITERHLAELEELADTQMQHPGRVSFKFIDKMQLNNSICYVKAAFPLMGKILERTEFKENSSNAQKMKMVRRMYKSIDDNVDPCIREEDDEERMLSQMCFKEFTTSPYEMLVLVKDFFQEIKRLLQERETFAKDCSQVYRRVCLGPKKAGSSPGVGTDPDCNCLSPALPSATQPSLSAATGRDTAPASTRVPSSLLHATLADLEAPSQPPSSTDGGSGTEEVLAAGLGDTALAPGMKQTAPGSSAEALQDPAGTLSLALGDIPVLRGDGELVEWGTGHLPQDPGQQWGGSILPEQRGGLRTSPPTASPSAARTRPAAAVTQLRFSRMAPELRALGSARDRARAWGWGLSRLRGPEDGGGAGPSFDSGFVLGAEQRRKEPPASEGRQEPLIYITVASVVAVLLATGGLLFYKYKSRVLQRPLEDGGCDPEEPERRALQGARECSELETQDL
ncbi:macrophage colony-stimulating factor 1 isoform X3 [Agelaius tricolor]|uniref:macrophage colony-stimulating factor 1 isoform X3 n=1 Tax=Agelaius tricolor TaxID=9191 RepID=UPI0039F1CCC9